MESNNQHPFYMWIYRIDQNPWSPIENAQWKSYSIEDNYKIENAYNQKQPFVILGDYEIKFSNMIQQKISDKFRQRPIRRTTNPSQIKGLQNGPDFIEELKKSQLNTNQQSNDNQNNQNIILCRICLQLKAEYTYSACGHVVSCFQCLNQLKNSIASCPICKQSGGTYNKIYY